MIGSSEFVGRLQLFRLALGEISMEDRIKIINEIKEEFIGEEKDY